jgi:hypothetical protein
MMMPPVSEENQRRFQEWYTQFLGHFIRVYERNAPPFVPYEVAWSDSEKRLQMYIEEVEKGSHGMDDVVDILNPEKAMKKAKKI